MVYGRAVYGDKGQIVGYNGYNILFGTAVRNYFDSANGMKRGDSIGFGNGGRCVC